MAVNQKLLRLAERASSANAMGRRVDERAMQRMLQESKLQQNMAALQGTKDRNSQNAWWRPVARIGGMALGAGAGALLALPTGGMSVGLGAALGASLGGGLGGEIAGAGMPGNAGGASLAQGAAPMLQYMAMQGLQNGDGQYGRQNPAYGNGGRGWMGGNYYGPDYSA